MTTVEFESEVLRINERYNLEIIEALGICPFARSARLAGTSTRRVVFGRHINPLALIPHIEALEHEEKTEVVQIILPLLDLGARAFQEFASELGKTNTARYGGGRPVFVHAAFHPMLLFSRASGAQLVPFFRRSPDPLIQLVRLRVLDSVHAGRPRGTQFYDGSPEALASLLAKRSVESVTEHITRVNYEAANKGDLIRIEHIFADILADRDRSYQRYGVTPTMGQRELNE